MTGWMTFNQSQTCWRRWRQERKEGSKETEDNRRTMERKRRWKINRRKDRYVCGNAAEEKIHPSHFLKQASVITFSTFSNLSRGPHSGK